MLLFHLPRELNKIVKAAIAAAGEFSGHASYPNLRIVATADGRFYATAGNLRSTAATPAKAIETLGSWNVDNLLSLLDVSRQPV